MKRIKIPPKDALYPASSTADKISPKPTYPNQPCNLKKIPVLSSRDWGTINLLHFEKCIPPTKTQPLLSYPTHHQLPLKTKEKKKPSAIKIWNFLDLLGDGKVDQASDPESDELNSEGTSPKLVK